MKNSVICFKSHFLNKRILRECKKLAADCNPSVRDVMMLYDNSRRDFKPSGEMCDYSLFDTNDMKKMGYRVHEDRTIWHNGDYPLLHFYRKRPDYPYYWMIEYDVYFKGCWEFFLKAYDKDDSDLLATYVQSPQQAPHWDWWGHHNLDVKCEDQRSVFFPVTRFSNKALRFLDEQYRAGKWGFCEVVSPTLLSVHGYKVSDLGQRFYEQKSFRYANPVSLEELFFLPKNKLYHPVAKSAFVEFVKRLFPKKAKIFLKKILGYKRT